MGYIDAVEATPEVYTLLFENEAVRVIEMSLKAGQTDNQHSHRDETVYFITGSKVKISLPDGNPMEADIPDGLLSISKCGTDQDPRELSLWRASAEFPDGPVVASAPIDRL